MSDEQYVKPRKKRTVGKEKVSHQTKTIKERAKTKLRIPDMVDWDAPRIRMGISERPEPGPFIKKDFMKVLLLPKATGADKESAIKKFRSDSKDSLKRDDN